MARKRPSAEMRTVSFEERTGIVTTVCAGASKPEEELAYIAAFRKLVLLSRQKNGCVLHLVDHRYAVIQATFGMERLSRKDAPMKTGDRTAIVVKPGGMNLNLASGSAFGDIRFFGDTNAALRWLNEGRAR